MLRSIIYTVNKKSYITQNKQQYTQMSNGYGSTSIINHWLYTVMLFKLINDRLS